VRWPLYGCKVGALRVVQLNSGSLIEPEWRERRHEVVAWLDRLKPDVVCLQEIWRTDSRASTATWLAEHLRAGDWNIAFEGVPAPSEFGLDPSLRWGCAVLSRLPIERHETVTLPGVDETNDSPWDRAALTMVIASIEGATVISAHLSPMEFRQKIRLEQVRFIHEKALAWHGGRNEPIVCCGDFNAEPMQPEITELVLLPGITWTDAWSWLHRDDPGHTQHPKNRFYVGEAKRIDYAFVGNLAAPGVEIHATSR
jgi:endonuclease/exonuclease/phosphatase family metal-dependent hydrolase